MKCASHEGLGTEVSPKRLHPDALPKGSQRGPLIDFSHLSLAVSLPIFLLGATVTQVVEITVRSMGSACPRRYQVLIPGSEMGLLKSWNQRDWRFSRNSGYVAQADFKLDILLPQPLELGLWACATTPDPVSSL